MLTLDQVQLKSLSRLNGLHPVLAAATVTLIERSYALPERKKHALRALSVLHNLETLRVILHFVNNVK